MIDFSKLLSTLRRKSKHLIRDNYSVVLIPSDNTATRQFQLPVLLNLGLKVLLGLIGCTIFALIIYSFYLSSYIRVHQPQFDEVAKLQSEATVKDLQIESLKNQNSQIDKKIQDVQAFETHVAGIIKFKPLDRQSVSRGSKTPQYHISSTTDQTSSELENNLLILQQLYDASLKYQDKMNHTPSIEPVQGDITSDYGYRHDPINGRSGEFHDGIDIGCNYNTPVHAAADGTVIFAGWDIVYGRKVEINHGNGITTFYGHNSKLVVKVGDKVKKGDIISYSGSTGRSTGPHLHYGVHINGSPANPEDYIDSQKSLTSQ